MVKTYGSDWHWAKPNYRSQGKIAAICDQPVQCRDAVDRLIFHSADARAAVCPVRSQAARGSTQPRPAAVRPAGKRRRSPTAACPYPRWRRWLRVRGGRSDASWRREFGHTPRLGPERSLDAKTRVQGPAAFTPVHPNEAHNGSVERRLGAVDYRPATVAAMILNLSTLCGCPRRMIVGECLYTRFRIGRRRGCEGAAGVASVETTRGGLSGEQNDCGGVEDRKGKTPRPRRKCSRARCGAVSATGGSIKVSVSADGVTSSLVRDASSAVGWQVGTMIYKICTEQPL
eukprot:6179971-Pleurochrysis_carterae.AAC.1